MLKNLYRLIEGWDNRRLVKRGGNSHDRVLSTFESFRINIGPIPIIGTTQDEIKSVYALERYKLDVAYNPGSYIKGVYSHLSDAIFLDTGVLRWSRQRELDHVLTHEYAHRLYNRYFQSLGRKREERNKIDRPALPGITEEIDLLRVWQEYVESLKKERRTDDDKGRLEFDIYFEEMYAEAVALYLTGEVDGDTRWYDYSDFHKGVVLRRDRQFTEKLEKVLYRLFYERLFSHGLRRVSVELPLTYEITRHTFEKTFQKAITKEPLQCPS